MNAPAPSFAQHVVLAIDDGSPESASLVVVIAEAPDTTVHRCSRGYDAYDHAMRVAPTVIVLDLERREESQSVLERFLRAPETEGVPVLVVGGDLDTDRADAFRLGASDYIERPVQPAELRTRCLLHSRAYLASVERHHALAALQRVQVQLRQALRENEDLRARAARDAGDKAPIERWRTRMSGLLQVGIELNQVQDFHTLMDRILDESRHLLNADAGTIFVREGDRLRFAFFQNETLARRTRSGETPPMQTFRIPINERSIAGWVALTGQPVNITDTDRLDPSLPFRFDHSFDQLLDYRTRSMLAMPLKNRLGRVLGVIELINARDDQGRPRDGGFTDEDQALIEHFASIATVALERTHLTESIIMRMIRMAEVHDPSETTPHVERVSGYAAILFEEWARRRGLEGANLERQRDRLRIAAKLHDVGKVGVSDRVLKKPGLLDEQERGEIERHVIIGGDLFDDMPTDYDEAAREVALMHHERWDGTGYPGILEGGQRRGRRGEEIPVFARIVAICDVFDALSSVRCYKPAWPEERVLDQMRSEQGRAFDPELIDILFDRLAELRAIRAASPEEPD